MEGENVLDVVYGVNPVREALRAGMHVERAFVHNPVGAAQAIIAKLRDRGVPIVEVAEEKLRALCADGGKAPNHQGIAIRIAPVGYAPLDELFEAPKARNEAAFIVLLDGVTDPHNFGAILRSAEAMGAHGVVVGKRRSAGLTATAFRASSGAAAHIKVAQVTNLVSTLDECKRRGLWVVGADADAPPCDAQNLRGDIVLCIGAEGEGLSRLIKQKCDLMAGIPLLGKTSSLNASCAASVLVYEIMRQRRAAATR
jgi:23S rRNA (guanosine2251-2'-O)-methyltransferase